jgi:two-component system, LytTR family, sensor histidine kinase NatK
VTSLQSIIFFWIICCSHLLLATNGIIPISIIIPIAIIASLLFSKHARVDWSWSIQILLITIYIINGPGLENLLVLLCSILLFTYNVFSQKELMKYKTSRVEVNTQLNQFNETFQMIRKERHDYLKHVAAIAYMLDKEDFLAAKSYMNNLIERYEETNLSIKGEQGAVASVLHKNHQEAKKKGIAISYQLEIPISYLPIPVEEVVELIGNIMENAIEACEAWQKRDKEQGFIELSLRKRSGLYILTCVNSTVPLPQVVADRLFVSSGVTTKDQHTGLGTTIIQQIVEKHHGFLEFVTERNTFSITCKIPHVL